MPNPFRITRGRALPNGGIEYGGGPPGDEDRDVFSPQQRQQVRLRLSRKTQLIYLMANGQGTARYGGEELQPNDKGEVINIRPGGSDNANESRDSAYGQPILRTLPSRLKPGHLDFASPVFDVAVPLANAATVGDLVRRVAKAANAEVYADPRLARLPLWTSSDGPQETARAGDVLRALCWAVTGTFRKVGPAAYVLTDDVAGLGTRKAALADWGVRAGKAASEQQEALQKQIRDQNPLPLLGYAPEDPLAKNDGLQKRITDVLRESGPFVDGLEVDAAGLPPALQNRLRHHTSRNDQNPQNALRDDRVKLGAILSKEWIVPGVGPVPDSRFDSALGGRDDLGDLLPPLTGLPPGITVPAPVPLALAALAGRFAVRALVVAPARLDEARQAIIAAKRRGLNQVWIVVDEGGDPALLGETIAAGKTSGVAVGAVVRLLHPPATSAGPPDADVNILGETSDRRAARRDAAGLQRFDDFRAIDVLRPDRVWLRPEAVSHRQTWLAELAKTPGLAGLALRDMAAPGYATPEAKGETQRDPRDGRNDFGYTESLRLACLRAHGVDPIDIDYEFASVGRVQLALPFFNDRQPDGSQLPDGSAVLRKRWNTLRAAVSAQALAPLHAVLNQNALPIFLRAQAEPTSDSDLRGGWWGTWERADPLPIQTPRDLSDNSGPRSLAPAARQLSKRVLLNVTQTLSNRYGPLPADYKPDEVQDFARALKFRLEREAGQPWDGLVLDLSEMPVADALRLLPALAEVGQ